MGTYIETDADLPLVQLCRRGGPDTSRGAAERVQCFAGEHCGRILRSLDAGPAGQSEIARRTGLTVAQVSKRMKSLRDTGKIVRDGDATSASGGREARYRRA